MMPKWLRRLFTRKPPCPVCGRRGVLYRPPGRNPLCASCWAATAVELDRQLSRALSLRCRAQNCGSRRM